MPVMVTDEEYYYKKNTIKTEKKEGTRAWM